MNDLNIKDRYIKFFSFLFISFLWLGCGKKKATHPADMKVISAYVNDLKLTEGGENVPTDVKISLTFNENLNKDAFKSAFSMKSEEGIVPFTITIRNTFPNNVLIEAHLAHGTKYTLKVDAGKIGTHSEQLEQPYIVSFTTAYEDVIRSLKPCTEGCEGKLHLATEHGSVNFEMYNNYPLAQEKTKLENLTSAIIVVHGVDRNADDYFSYLTSTLINDNLEESTVLVAPWFQDNSQAGTNGLYWNTSNWREGQNSSNSMGISSFSVIDTIISRLADKQHFPNLKTIIITGHSSGAAFTDVYAASNTSDAKYPDIDFEYIIANSQFFYYPNDYRYDEGSGTFYKATKADCSTFNDWPFGYYGDIPAYLNDVAHDTLNKHFAERNVIYLLGNGTQPDPSLSNNCHSSILGSTRFKRGEHMFAFMNEFFPENKHSKKIVQGIGHNGEKMYKSPEFSNLIQLIVSK